MHNRLLRLVALVMLAAALLPALAAGAGAEGGFSVAESISEPREGEAADGFSAEEGDGELAFIEDVPLSAGELREVELSDIPAGFAFTAPTGSVYDVWLFPAGDAPAEVRARLWQGDELAAESDGETMPALSLRLTAGADYALRLTGRGRVRLEIARHALGRCFGDPMALDAAGDEHSKAFARKGDAHWYAVEPGADGALALAAVPGDTDVALQALLFDGDGRLLGGASITPGGAALTRLEAKAGARYLLRLTARNGATGLYSLRLVPVAGEAPAMLTLSRQRALLAGRTRLQLTAETAPSGASDFILWESSDAQVASVSADGRVTSRSEGEADITAYAAGGASARCRVTVRYVAVEEVRLLSRQMALCVGDDAAIECDVLPGNATDPRLTYVAEPEGVVEIDRRGVLRGVSEGECTVTVRAVDGGWMDTLAVAVGPAPKRWRALLVGEQNYASTVASVRTGSINSVSGLRSMLAGLSFGGARFATTTLLDASRDGILAGIRDAFAGAKDGDVALFYITCHGYYEGGMTCFRLYDGSVLTAAELAGALAEVPGEMLLVIDCCGSGGAIGRSSGAGDILRGVDAVFGGNVGPAAVNGSRFRVLASAAQEQDSHRISFAPGGGESGMATVFARALCEAGGWDLQRSARSAMRADVDYDGRVTLSELYEYVSRRVMWYLSLAGEPGRYAQSVQVWPEGLADAVFERTE